MQVEVRSRVVDRKGRGMELSDLCLWRGHLLSMVLLHAQPPCSMRR